jgi:hypothetical protein
LTLYAQVIKLISQVIADFADGEIRQMGRVFDTDLTMEDYMDKSFYKTASLIAASCRCFIMLPCTRQHLCGMGVVHKGVTSRSHSLACTAVQVGGGVWWRG